MNPIEGLEQQSGVSGKGVRGSGHLDTAVVVLANGVKPDGSASQVTGDVFEPSGLIVIDELGGMNGKAGWIPLQQLVTCSCRLWRGARLDVDVSGATAGNALRCPRGCRSRAWAMEETPPDA